MRGVGIFIFDDVEVLDFAGPFEVFSTAARVAARDGASPEPFRVFTVAAVRAPVRARGGLRIEPGFAFGEHPPLDVLIVPGGVVTAALDQHEVIAWITASAARAMLTASVCTGAFLLGKAGLLAGRRATTHWEDLVELRKLLPETQILGERRWVDEGSIVTSAGISAGIDMCLHLVARLAGEELAQRTAKQMDYRWNRDA